MSARLRARGDRKEAAERPAVAESALFFATPVAWRRWLEKNHEKSNEVWVGFAKRSTGKKSITWPESVDEALCFGWIDGLRKRIDDEAYTIRFTPRKATSIWSEVNVKRVAELTKLGRMAAAGVAAYERRKAARTGVYSHERKKDAELPPPWEKRFRANRNAWAYFESRAPSYRRAALHWVTSAKKEDTQLRRFEQLLADSANERTVGPLTRP